LGVATYFCAAQSGRDEVAMALETSQYRRLDAKAALRFFELVMTFDDATNAVAVAAAEWAEATEALGAHDAGTAAAFELEASKQYVYERSSGRLYRLEVQAAEVARGETARRDAVALPKVVRVLERRMEAGEGAAYLAAQGVRTELIARQQVATEAISLEEEKASGTLAALGAEFGVDNHAWADLYLIPGRTDVILVQGRYPVVPPVPVVPTRSGEVPEGTFWVHGVEFMFPEKSRPVMARLIEAAGRLEILEPWEVEHISEEWGRELVAVSDLSTLLRSGRVTLSGDRTLSIRSLSRDGELVAQESVLPAVMNLLSAVQDSGYYLAGLSRSVEPPVDGVLTVHVDSGRVGDVTVVFQGAKEDVSVTDGRWYSGDQIRRRFSRSTPGKPFDYGALYDALSAVNESQDISVNTDVRVRQEQGEDGSVSRVADMTLDVQESMPIHATVEVGNDGSEQSGNWWVGASLRHQNLTRNDDVLSVEAQTAVRDAEMYAFSGSYLLPHHWGGGGTFGIYGGYSKLDINDLIPGIGVSGIGKYAGARISQRLVETRHHRIELAAGQTFRWTDESLDYGGVVADKREAMVAPYYAQLSWQQKALDGLGGRTFAMVEVSQNFGDWLGTSGELDSLRVFADADYTIGCAQVARLQALGGAETALDSQWTLFARATGQISDGPLIAMEQSGLGGASTVRGYAERELLGDNAAFGSIEVRTPVFRVFDDLRDRLQLVLFTDAGWASLRKKQPGEAENDFLLSAGLGVRYAVWQNALLRLDWGFPIEKTHESDHGGRGHVNFQLQF